ncbi:DUF6544 family protein [Halomicroarcula sp. GCM10025324]|uniref:DUF6544 family protein n=1 Tax=Haloarcula TaxID=2237 RepID=UPI0023E858A6|nr:DUF6544 family protein [Halomicroarcula sp. ZS-22-S1]
MNFSPSTAGRRILAAAGLLGATAVLGVGVQRRRFAREIATRTDRLHAAATVRDGAFDRSELAGLPDPVANYFETVLQPGLAYATSVSLHQTGTFRLGDAGSPWRSLEATQHYTTRPPGFVWDATIDVAPLIRARVLDAYVDGDGILDARVLSAIRVANAGPSPEMDTGELLRYLAEAVWFPTALLPSNGVEWRAVSATAASATIEHRGNTASVVFHFDDGVVDRVTAERFRQAAGDDAPWTGTFENYQNRNGRLIPTRAAVEWTLPDGALPYWRATIDDVEHRSERPGDVGSRPNRSVR